MRIKNKQIIKGTVAALFYFYSSASIATTHFVETFDGQDNWTTESKSQVGSLPPNWDYARTEETWHPTDTVGSKPSMMITGENPEQVFGEQGKAFVNYSESYKGGTGWASDGFITKDIDPSNEVYVEFRLKFQPGFAPILPDDYSAKLIKIFRVLSWDKVEPRSKFFENGNSSPIYVFDWAYNKSGVRHKHAFRCDDQESNYKCTNPRILNPPREVVSGGMSASFTDDIALLSAQLPDLVNGGLLPTKGVVTHDQVYGDKWHKLAFYLKQNSAPGVQDGILKFWMDDQLLIDMDRIPWIGPNGDMGALWNSVSFGGNDHYHFNLDENASVSARERWYAIDDILISDKVPEASQGTLSGTNFYEQFDEQDEWSTGDKDNVYSYPAEWDYVYTQEQWHPSETVDSFPSIKITGEKTEQVFGGTGKAMVNYVESYNNVANGGFSSNGLLTKDIAPTDELFAQFKIKFQPGFASNDEHGVVKIFKALSYNYDGKRENLSETGFSSPIYSFDWVQNEWGLRHVHKFRCDAKSDNFHCIHPSILNPPKEVVWGNMSANFTGDVKHLSPQIKDLVLGSNIPPNGTVFHNQVYGDQWHTLAFYLKHNSAPGVQDGILKVWLDKQLIVDMNQVPWIGEHGNMEALWNSVSFGGPDRFHFNLDENTPVSERERWFSIDDIVILDKLPATQEQMNFELKCYWELVE